MRITNGFALANFVANHSFLKGDLVELGLALRFGKTYRDLTIVLLDITSRRRSLFEIARDLEAIVLFCTCPAQCDCQNPPPEEPALNGVYHVSEECPIHNYKARASPACLVHDSPAY